MNILKRDGKIEEFDPNKIKNAVLSAFEAVDGEIDIYAIEKANNISNYILKYLNEKNEELSVEEIQDLVEKGLMSGKRKDVARAYISYRNERTIARGNPLDEVVEEIVEGKNEYWKTENSNKNPILVTTQRDYIAGAYSTDLSRRKLLPKEIIDAHDQGLIHFHDLDYFAQNALTNCELLNLDDMLQNGTVINGVKIDKPHRLLTATTIATQIILAVTSSTYGGCTITLTHLAPFVRDSYNRHLKDAKNELILHSEEDWFEKTVEDIAKKRTAQEITAAVQTFNYQVNSMTNTNGQSPFLTVFMYLGETEEYKFELSLLIEEFLRQRLCGFKNKKGVYVSPAFPKLIYVLEEDNIHEDSKYYYLTELSAKCSTKRLVPDYISEKKMKEIKVDADGRGYCFPSMGCRSFLSVWKDKQGQAKFYSRFNQGVVTINLADVALSSKRDIDAFWEILETRLELCHRGLQLRHERLSHVISDVAPILWQHGALARLEPGESIHKLLHGGYSSISLGYAALYECVKYMTGESHTQKNGEKFAKKVMQKLNDKCEEWKNAEDIGYSVYGTPLESTTYKFAKCLKNRFGIIEGITDRDYVTNSYHIPVFEHIDAFSKFAIESKYQELSQGGMISYCEIPNMQNNIPAVLELIKYIYNNIMYAELNTKSDYCQKCGFDGEIEIKGEEGSLYWQCPNCGNTDQNTLNVVRRTCGYLGSNFWNQGRTAEIKDRVLHLD